jgi:hypothetical protein
MKFILPLLLFTLQGCDAVCIHKDNIEYVKDNGKGCTTSEDRGVHLCVPICSEDHHEESKNIDERKLEWEDQ